MARISWIAIGALLLTLQQAHCQAVRAATGHCDDRPDMKGERIVKTGDDAIRVAFALLRAVNPEYKKDEKEFSKNVTATIHDCVWSVAEKPETPEDYSHVVMRIGAIDGRLIEINITD
jgi:hypothetical protein